MLRRQNLQYISLVFLFYLLFTFRNIERDVIVSLQELYRGSLDQKIEVKRICKECEEREERNQQCQMCHGKDATKVIDVDIMKHVNLKTHDPSQVLAIIDRHMDGEMFTPTLTLREKPHEFFLRNGIDLIMRMTIDFVESLTFFERAIKTPTGEWLRIKCDKPTQDKSKMTLKGWGLPHNENGELCRGDIIIFCRVKQPPQSMLTESNTLKESIRKLLLDAMPLDANPSTPNLDHLEESPVVTRPIVS